MHSGKYYFEKPHRLYENSNSGREAPKKLEAECPIPRNLKSGLVVVFEHSRLLLVLRSLPEV